MIPTPPDSRLGNMLSLHPVHDNPRPLTPHTHQQIEAWASHLGVDQSTPGTPSSPGTPIHR